MSVISFTVANIESRTVVYSVRTEEHVHADFNGRCEVFVSVHGPGSCRYHAGTTITGYITTDKYGAKLDPKTVTVVMGGGVPAASSAPPPAMTEVAPKPAYTGRGARSFPVGPTDPDMAIIRQNALTNAVSTVADYVATQPTEKWPTLDEWVEMVISVGLRYSKFSSGQREMEAQKNLAKMGMQAAEINAAVEATIGKEEAA